MEDFNLLDLYAGGGGFHLAAGTAGFYFKKVYYSEINPYATKIYKSRFPSAVALGDVRRVTRRSCATGGRWIITAGFPCQPFSVAGNQLGIDDDRYHWHQVVRISKEFQPDGFIFENVAGIESVAFSTRQTRLEVRQHQRTPEHDVFETVYSREEELQLYRCCEDLEKAGASFQVFDIPALGVNAWHRRRRIWIVGSFTDFTSQQIHEKREQSKRYCQCEGRGLEVGREAIQQNYGTANSDKSCRCSGDDATNNSHNSHDGRPQRQNQSESEGLISVGRQPFRDGRKGVCALADINACRCQKQQQSEQVETQHARTKHGFGDDSDIEILGQQEQGIGESLRLWQASGFNAHLEWRRHWIEIAAALCRSDDGLSVELDITRLRDDIARLYPEAAEKDIARAIQKLETEYRRARIELLGNSIVPQIPVEFFKIFKAVLQGD